MTVEEMLHQGSVSDEIIALKLKKPKNWNWELTTSKSSPHILLPVIKLYDYRGNLVLETQDTGPVCQRKSWHSDCHQTEKQWRIPRESKLRTTQSERRCSDKRDVPTPNNPGTSINRRDRRRSHKNNDDLARSSCENINVTAGNSPKQPGKGGTMEQNKDAGRGRCSGMAGFKDGYLEKSKSDLLWSEGQRHRRTRSDDVYKRKLKFNDEQPSKCSQFNATHSSTSIDKNINNNSSKDGTLCTSGRGVESFSKHDSPYISENSDNTRIMQSTTHPRYKTRTSSAGTLIISEESFYRPNRRKRLERENTSADMTSAKISRERAKTENEREISAKSSENEFNCDHLNGKTSFESRRSTLTSCSSTPYRISFPTTDDDDNSVKTIISQIKRRNDGQNSLEFVDGSASERVEDICQPKDLRRSTSNLAASTRNAAELSPQTSRQPSQLMHRKKKRRKVRDQRRLGDGSTSSDADSAEWRSRGEEETSATRACIKPKQHHSSAQIFHTDLDVPDGGSSAAHLLDLVRHLSSQADRHVTVMGANVSRHSSKGLSGRRSQSSGSICNGKGRHSKGEFCGSLPSYLDERDTGGCNNNYDCEKAAVDEVPRIPPLGDGAPLHWKFSDTQTALCDQGYGSERSPEEEYPPPLPEHDHHFLEPHECYPFITPESTFLVKLNKGSRGLGLSVTGGIDSGGSWPGLIRIKRLFPHQPASQCGLINVGDLLLEANGSTLIGLTNYEALEVLRTAPNQVELKICRPPPDVLTCVSPISEVPPPPPRREAAGGPSTPPLGYSSPEDDYYHGEFEIIINKIQGSLGFTLRKEDDSALGHYVRALVREPALTDGRIRAGDKIVAVNDVEISPMSHEQAVQFLRQCGEEVKLRLYRDASQTPVAALSPTETTPRTSFSRKSNLRQEAVDMLNDIAVRKLIPGHDEGKGPDQGQANDSFGQGPASMPHIPLENSSAGFSYKNPAYQTAHPSCVTDHEEQPPAPSRTAPPPQQQMVEDCKSRKCRSSVLEEKDEPIQSTAEFEMQEENEILAIELNRGWNSRLGFSLQGAAGVTYVSAVYANSVAARDGRLKPGDRVIRVNDESVEHMTTTEIIDLLRIVRGPVCIVVSRTNSKEDCIKSNAAN
ncbi:uncharacterized protein LOC123315343 isoform X2 [Coccinella septempunctata]|uniref:uncharacterized protein LOC123315343 isoform X2 n=1 Tax=Coccinella septempunctata TaxID=41139 RepID=UPI001D077BAC|nr:uncharacterized protein LOC123315343 isoform X2 [Coccinella septempunctata]